MNHISLIDINLIIDYFKAKEECYSKKSNFWSDPKANLTKVVDKINNLKVDRFFILKLEVVYTQTKADRGFFNSLIKEGFTRDRVSGEKEQKLLHNIGEEFEYLIDKKVYKARGDGMIVEKRDAIKLKVAKKFLQSIRGIRKFENY